MSYDKLGVLPEYVDEILPEHLPDGLLSIAVFGPGKGEAIVVRLPDGSIGVVDGCLEPTYGDKDPTGEGDPVRELLNRIAPARLLFACLTHAHADHYAGLGRLLAAYQKRADHVWMVLDAGGPFMKAQLAILKRRRARKTSLPDAANPKGLERVLTQFSEAHRSHTSKLNYLQAGMPLLAIKHGTKRVRITACGPAPSEIDRLKESLTKAIDKSIKQGEETEQEFDLNIASGALLIRWAKAGVLLAGDLLCSTNENAGWTNAAEHIDGPIQIVNVAHHASKEAHDEALWKKMLPQLAIVTPFNHGATHEMVRNGITGIKKHPPRPEQIAFLAQSSTVAITSPPRWDGEINPPKARRHSTPTPATPTPPHRNAVAVSLDSAGIIQKFVLAGQADVYVP
ncbi:MAG TPA: MBL fold metallo-hydrolase [Polyangium sp.]|nr:MBL fold metallo-hydrolase [Polyangium sp.]